MSEAVLSSHEINEFRRSEVLRVGLKEALEAPGIREALQAIQNTVLPRSIPAAIPGNHPDTAIAHQFYRQFGVQQVLSTLAAMTIRSGDHPLESESPLEEFAANLPKHLQNPPAKK